MKKYLGLILCGTIVLTGCTKVPKLQNGQEVVADINGKQFTAEDFYASMRDVYGTTALVNMVDDYIISQELTEDMSKSAKTTASAQFKSYKSSLGDNFKNFLSQYGYTNEEDFEKDIIKNEERQAVLKKYVNSTIKEEEINKYYNDNIYGEMTVRHILIIPEVKDTMSDDEKAKAKEEALAKAKLLINQLSESKDLEKDFTELAKKESNDTGSASEGGLISNFTNESGFAEEFFNASKDLEVSKMTTEPVETQFGYHIIYKVSQNEKPTLDSVKDKVISKLTTDALAKENATYVYWIGLREKYNLNIYDDAIKSKYNAIISQY